MEISLTIVVIFGVWIILLSAVVAWIFNYFQRFSKEVGKGNLIRILEKILETEGQNAKSLSELEREVARIGEAGRFYLQKLGLVRFNPFHEMGGDHSFSLALLDATDSGFILTGLHTRERTRIYIKRVKKGKSEHELSEEEDKALRLAKKSKSLV